jgi:hypothetical protein
MNIKNSTEWKIYVKTNKPDNIPSNPSVAYKDKGWISLGQWLGTNSIAPQKKLFLDFKTAKEYVRKLNLKSNKEWRLLIKTNKKPYNIPTAPDAVYAKKGWKSWADWLGNGAIANSKMEFVDFDTARNHARNLKLNSVKEWNLYSKSGKRPSNIPSNPQNPYKNKGWKGWADFLGKEK